MDQSCLSAPQHNSFDPAYGSGGDNGDQKAVHPDVLYLDEVLVVIPEEEDEIQDTRGLRTLEKIKTYNIKSGIYNFASVWKQVKISTLANCWKKLLQDIDPELDFEGFEAQDFHRVFQACREQRTGGVARGCGELAG